LNKIFVAELSAAILIVGLMLSPLFTTQFPFKAQAAPPCQDKKVLLIANEKDVQIIDRLNENALIYGPPLGGLRYHAMTWNGTIPGPVISVDQCDRLHITVKNQGAIIHSIDFHAGNGPSNAVSGNIPPLGSKTFILHADTPGVFMYHCTGDKLFDIWGHIANGMYGGIVVHPRTEQPAKEFYMVFSEIYTNSIKGKTTGYFDLNKFKADNPDVVLTNGISHRYVPSIGAGTVLHLTPGGAGGLPAEIFKVQPNELTRWYIVNPGPNDNVAFHFISGMIDVFDGFTGTGGAGSGKLNQELRQDETWSIPAGSAAVIEAKFPQNGNVPGSEGIYIGVDHSMKDVLKGGAFVVKATTTSTPTDHPDDRPVGGVDTCVSPKGSPFVTCP
jgi:nitrite reductase (NO-forming)